MPKQHKKGSLPFILHLRHHKTRIPHFQKNHTIHNKTFCYSMILTLDYQRCRQAMTSQQTVKQKTSKRNNFSDHDYNFLHFKKNNKNPIFEQSEANKSRKIQMKGPKKPFIRFFSMINNDLL